MDTQAKTIQLITKLIRETSENQITWNTRTPPKALIAATEDQVHTFFQTYYKNKTVSIFERKSKYFFDENEFYWTSSIVFAVFDLEENLLWEFSENTPVLIDLFNTVRAQITDIDSLLNDLLE